MVYPVKIFLLEFSALLCLVVSAEYVAVKQLYTSSYAL
jgi:hypothetical protein